MQGYGLRLAYDASALALVSATGQQASVFAEGVGPVALQARAEEGEVLLSDVLQPDVFVAGSAEVVRLVFRVLDRGVPGRVEIVEAMVADGMGGVNHLAGVHLEERPSAYVLSQNIPNPFNPQTTIRYALPEASQVQIVIYNVMGQQVRTLMDEDQGAGSHQVVWNGRDALGYDVASGVYFVRMQAGTFLQTRKMLLVR